MADTNEEQLLSDLLSDIAREDARLDAAHLESRVISAVEASAVARSIHASFGETSVSYWTIAAAVAVTVLVPALFWLTPQVPMESADVKVEAAEQSIADTPAVVAQPPSPTQLTRPTRPTNPTQPTQPAFSEPIAESPIAQLPVIPSPDEFVPLMPLTEQELAGPFQIVRVQMPRASLGTLRSPLQHPNELVEADVLLGEDGMARAIRVSTSGSVYPWRSR